MTNYKFTTLAVVTGIIAALYIRITEKDPKQKNAKALLSFILVAGLLILNFSILNLFRAPSTVKS